LWPIFLDFLFATETSTVSRKINTIFSALVFGHRMPITKEQLFTAADALVADGIEPTLEAIRSKLGVVMPPPTDAIAETNAMNAWKAHHATKRQLAGESVPTAIIARVNQFSNELWAKALAQANELIAPERKAMEIARTEFETRQRQTQSDAQSLHAQLIAANERTAVALARADELDKPKNGDYPVAQCIN
jgi:Plasmid replication region DNA-binding N-term